MLQFRVKNFVEYLAIWRFSPQDGARRDEQQKCSSHEPKDFFHLVHSSKFGILAYCFTKSLLLLAIRIFLLFA
jgi:hypothetical protein